MSKVFIETEATEASDRDKDDFGNSVAICTFSFFSARVR
jgi:hypothetical protein